MGKHFKLTNETKINAFGITLYRIECTLDIKWAKVGDKGGWVETEDNINGNAWVSDNAEVYGNARSMAMRITAVSNHLVVQIVQQQRSNVKMARL